MTSTIRNNDSRLHLESEQLLRKKQSVNGNTMSDSERHHLIEARAYFLWEQAGKPDGDAVGDELWLSAE